MPITHANAIGQYYELNGSGPTLVFIHGLGSSTRDWEAQTRDFSRDYRVLTFDLRGHGRSEKPSGPYSIPLFAGDVAGLLAALHISSAHVVGLSLGGAVAFQFALDHPPMVKTLTIVNSAPTLLARPEDARREVERRVAIVQEYGMRAMGQALSVNLFPQPEHAGLRETFVERWAENDPCAYIEATRSLLGWDVTERLGSIICPTLVIAAAEDYTPVAVKEAYLRRLPYARLVVIPCAHHMTPVEQPVEFNAALRAFLREHDG